MQQLWMNRLTASTVKEYARVCRIINNRLILNEKSFAVLAKLLETAMENLRMHTPPGVHAVGPGRNLKHKARLRKDPVLFVVSMLDKENASFDRVLEDIKAKLTPNVIPVEVPIGEGPSFRGILNLFSKKAHIYRKGTKTGEYDETDVGPELKETFDRHYQQMIDVEIRLSM